MRPSVLIVDDEAGVRSALSGVLRDEGFEVDTVPSGEACLEIAPGRHFDVILLDVWLPGIDGLLTLSRLRDRHVDAAVVVISGHGNIESAVRAVKMGAFDFVEKPLSIDKTLHVVRNALRQRQLEEENRALREHVDRRFVEVNCAAIPEELIESELFGHVRGAFTGAVSDRRGRFELADEGTIFLDEVADMSLKTQAKVLRVLQEQVVDPVGGHDSVRVDVRVLAATNKDLTAEIRAGRFREDLFFRLNVIPIFVPPLREREEDIPRLIAHFMQETSREHGRRPRQIDPDAMDVLRRYPWPGNVRELRNVVERLLIMVPGEVVEPPHLTFLQGGHVADGFPEPSSGPSLPLHEARERFERDYIVRTLATQQGNISRTAEVLGVERSNLYRKMKAFGIVPARREPREGPVAMETPNVV